MMVSIITVCLPIYGLTTHQMTFSCRRALLLVSISPSRMTKTLCFQTVLLPVHLQLTVSSLRGLQRNVD